MEQQIRILIEVLVSKGIEITAIPAFIRDVGTSIATNPAISLLELNSHLQLLGWGDFKLDDDTFYLIIVTFEPDFEVGLTQCFDSPFNPKGFHKLVDEKEHVPTLQIDNNEPLQE